MKAIDQDQVSRGRIDAEREPRRLAFQIFFSVWVAMLLTVGPVTARDSHLPACSSPPASGDWTIASCSIHDDVTIPAGVTLKIPSSSIELDLKAGSSLTNQGAIENSGTINISGPSSGHSAAVIYNSGTINNCGHIESPGVFGNTDATNTTGGTIHDSGRIVGLQPLGGTVSPGGGCTNKTAMVDTDADRRAAMRPRNGTGAGNALETSTDLTDCQPITSMSTPPVQPTDPNKPASPPDLHITDCRTVTAGTFTAGYVNITSGGTLKFVDSGQQINFYAKSILIEQNGALIAGSAAAPFGRNLGKLTLGLWGAGPQIYNQDGTFNSSFDVTPAYDAIACKGTDGCYPGDPGGSGNGTSIKGNFCVGPDLTNPCQATSPGPSGNNAYFEGYHSASNGDSLKLKYDNSYFGYKVLAVSYGGSLQLFGNKGVSNKTTATEACSIPTDPTDPTAWAAGSETSWARLDADAACGAASIKVDRGVDWESGDKLVVTSTDWYPSHNELVQVASVTSSGAGASSTSTVGLASEIDLPGGSSWTKSKDPNCSNSGTALIYPHRGKTYCVGPTCSDPSELSNQPGNATLNADLRGAVGLLSRDITIRSMGSSYSQSTGEPDPFPEPPTFDCSSGTCNGPAESQGSPNDGDSYFGGHVIARQGFGTFQVQGVEFYQLGQGGRVGHYPVHFHLAKDTSYTDAFVVDSSIWASNTRFAVVHGSHDVLVARNVGYLSNGHGYYLEDGSEINNSLCYNLGAGAQSAVAGYFAKQPVHSPARRFSPPILPGNGGSGTGGDAQSPTLFWIMNAHNDFIGNFAAGTHGTGVCYWPQAAGLSGPSANLQWDSPTVSNIPYGYAKFNQDGGLQAPFKTFRGNTCSTSAYAFMTSAYPELAPPGTVIENPYASTHQGGPAQPAVGTGANYQAGVIGYNCTQKKSADNGPGCPATLIDNFRASFNWAQLNFGAVWLRPHNWVFSNSAVTDQLSGGLGFVSGGSPEQAIQQRLGLSYGSLFVGSTDSDSSYSSSLAYDSTWGPQVADENAALLPHISYSGDAFKSLADGTSWFAGSGFNPKRLLTIYDGPMFSDGSVFDVQNLDCTFPNDPPFGGGPQPMTCGLYATTHQPLKDLSQSQMTVINAGIGWKQPNAFYYPPSFSFRRSGFRLRTDEFQSTRHNVADQYQCYVTPGSLGTSGSTNQSNSTCQPPTSLNPNDFTTILNDLDGTLNGVKAATGKSKRSSGLSNNVFYAAPDSVSQCDSFGTQTTAQEFVTTSLTPLSPGLPNAGKTTGSLNGMAGTIYRQYTLPLESSPACPASPSPPPPPSPPPACNVPTGSCPPTPPVSCGSGISTDFFKGTALTMNNGLFYIDTSGFSAGETYMVYNLFADSQTSLTYQFYVGNDFNINPSPPTPSPFQWAQMDVHGQVGGDGIYTAKSFTPSAHAPANANCDPTGLACYDSTTGILKVTLDHKTLLGRPGYQETHKDLRCFPRNLCQPSATPGDCKAASTIATNPLLQDLESQINDICQTWSAPASWESSEGLYLDTCPPGGCLGFAFTMPSGFTSKTYAEAGAALAVPYPDEAPWNVGLAATDASNCPTTASTPFYGPAH